MTDPRRNGPDEADAGGRAGTVDPLGLFGASWTASMDALSAWSQTWQSLLETRGAPSAQLMMGALDNPAHWLQGVTPLLEEIRRALALPRLADLPSLDGGRLPSPESSIDLMLLLQQYLAAVMPVWMKACETFQDEVEARRTRGETPDLLGDGMDIWNTALDRTLMEFNRSQDFAALQQRMLRVAMHQRQELRRNAETAAEAVGMPTRTEMLDVYQRLHGLMREVHGLRRDLRALTAERNDGGDAPHDAAKARARRPRPAADERP